jgi:hypothetical protein
MLRYPMPTTITCIHRRPKDTIRLSGSPCLFAHHHPHALRKLMTRYWPMPGLPVPRLGGQPDGLRCKKRQGIQDGWHQRASHHQQSRKTNVQLMHPKTGLPGLYSTQVRYPWIRIGMGILTSGKPPTVLIPPMQPMGPQQPQMGTPGWNTT